MAQEAQLGRGLPEGNGDMPITEDVQKKSKQGPRKRVSQACDKCRSRKDKCDGKKPVRLSAKGCLSMSLPTWNIVRRS
jgi:hypothetical protein